MTTTINTLVWRVIDNDAATKRNLLQGVINTSALARKIATENDLAGNIDAVISAIRRYEGSDERKDYLAKVFALLKEAKLSTKTKLASILLKKNAEVRKKLAKLYAEVDFEAGETLRIFEVTRHIKIIVDEKNAKAVKDIFTRSDIVSSTASLGELSIIYSSDITKTPGLFATLSNELASSGVSIVDSMICHSEHLIIVEEKEVERAFTIVFRLTHG